MRVQAPRPLPPLSIRPPGARPMPKPTPVPIPERAIAPPKVVSPPVVAGPKPKPIEAIQVAGDIKSCQEWFDNSGIAREIRHAVEACILRNALDRCDLPTFTRLAPRVRALAQRPAERAVKIIREEACLQCQQDPGACVDETCIAAYQEANKLTLPGCRLFSGHIPTDLVPRPFLGVVEASAVGGELVGQLVPGFLQQPPTPPVIPSPGVEEIPPQRPLLPLPPLGPTPTPGPIPRPVPVLRPALVL